MLAPFTGVQLQERTLSTEKLISQSYLGNETEEDAIMPILTLIRESMVDHTLEVLKMQS